MIKLRLIFILFILSTITNPYLCQFGGGLRASGSYYLAKKDYKIPSFGAFITYDFDISQSLRVGYMMGLSHDFSLLHTSIAADTSYTPRRKEVTQHVQLKNFTVFVEYQKYLSDMSDKENGLYANVGLAFLSSSALSNYSNLDANYTIPNYEISTEKDRYNQVMIRASLGYDIKISIIKWYIEAGIGMPASTSEQQSVNHAYLPGFLEISTGFKF